MMLALVGCGEYCQGILLLVITKFESHIFVMLLIFTPNVVRHFISHQKGLCLFCSESRSKHLIFSHSKQIHLLKSVFF